MSLLLPTVVGVIYSCYAYRYTRNGKHVTNQFCASTPDGCLQPPRSRERSAYVNTARPNILWGCNRAIVQASASKLAAEREKERDRVRHHGSSTVLRDGSPAGCARTRGGCARHRSSRDAGRNARIRRSAENHTADHLVYVYT
jgi:hypothetical protein